MTEQEYNYMRQHSRVKTEHQKWDEEGAKSREIYNKAIDDIKQRIGQITIVNDEVMQYAKAVEWHLKQLKEVQNVQISS